MDLDDEWLLTLNHPIGVFSGNPITCAITVHCVDVPGDSGGAILADGGYRVTGLDVVRTEFSHNQASTGPAIAQTGNMEDGSSRTVVFVDLTFEENTLLCQDGEYLHQVTNVSATSSSFVTTCSAGHEARSLRGGAKIVSVLGSNAPGVPVL